MAEPKRRIDGGGLMPRGFRKDISATREARAKGLLSDKRSFISQPKAIPGECDTPEPHLLLFGADKTRARMYLFQRQHNRCEECNCIVVWGSDDFGWSEYGDVGEWMHLRDKPWNKCDCPANASLRCHKHHQGPGTEHYKRRPRWGVKHGPEKVAV